MKICFFLIFLLVLSELNCKIINSKMKKKQKLEKKSLKQFRKLLVSSRIPIQQIKSIEKIQQSKKMKQNQRKLLTKVINDVFGQNFVDSLGGADFLLSMGFVGLATHLMSQYNKHNKLEQLQKQQRQLEIQLEDIKSSRTYNFEDTQRSFDKLVRKVSQFAIDLEQLSAKVTQIKKK